METLTATAQRVPPDLKYGAGALLVGMIVNITFESSTAINGVIVSCSYIGLGEIIGGGLAALLGLRQAVTTIRGGQAQRKWEYTGPPVIVAGLALLALGTWLLARGFGLIGNPCG